jgi:hypothetical protein
MMYKIIFSLLQVMQMNVSESDINKSNYIQVESSTSLGSIIINNGATLKQADPKSNLFAKFK